MANRITVLFLAGILLLPGYIYAAETSSEEACIMEEEVPFILQEDCTEEADAADDEFADVLWELSDENIILETEIEDDLISESMPEEITAEESLLPDSEIPEEEVPETETAEEMLFPDCCIPDEEEMEIEAGESALVLLESGASSGMCGDSLTWTLDPEGTLTISGTGEMADYDEDTMWSHDGSIKSVIIQDGVISIGKGMFQGCSSLQSVSIPQSVLSIGREAFDSCSALSDVRIPDNVTRIGYKAFQYCSCLTEISIPSSVEMIDGYAFYYCTGLTTVSLQASIPYISMYTFGNCTSLKNITIPSTVKEIRMCAFADCTSLQSFIVPSNVERIEKAAFARCTGLVSITIPSSVTTMEGGEIFNGCNNLDFTIHTSCNSTAMVYARNLGIPFVTDDSTPHTLPDWEITKPATCTASGTRERTCTVCGKVFTENIPAANHTAAADPAVAATCTKTGLTEGSHCSVCKKILVERKTIAALGHYSDGGKVTKAATCTAGGLKTYTCSRCGTQLKTETIAAAGHKEVTDQAAAPTCLRTGLTAGSHCSVCNAVLKKQEAVPAKAHTWGSWSVIAEATALKEGNRARTCRECGTKQVDKVAKLPAKLELAKSAVTVKKTKSCAVQAVISNGDSITVGSSNTKIAAAEYEDGKVIIRAGKKAGTAVVTVKTKTGKSAAITVKVPKVKTKKIKCKKLTVSLGKKEKLKPVITPSYSDDKVKYSVKNKKIATVSKKGVVKGKKVGTTTVTIKSGKKSVKVKISVVDLDTYNNVFSGLLGG